MSRESLKAFLEKLDKELKGSSGPYRREADRREMTFYYNAGELSGELFHEFKLRGLLDVFGKQEVQSFITQKSLEVLAKCRPAAQKIKARRGTKIVSNQYMIKVTLGVEKNPKTDKAYVNFTKLKEVYTKAINDFVLDLNTFLVETQGTQLKKTKQT